MMVRNVAIDLPHRTLVGSGGVEGAVPAGSFSANSIHADLDARVIALVGNASDCGWCLGSCGCREPETRMPEMTQTLRTAARSFAAAFVASAIVALGYGSLAEAQAIAGFNSNQPVSYAADRIELQDRQNRVVLSGDVVDHPGRPQAYRRTHDRVLHRCRQLAHPAHRRDRRGDR
jgi:hypothetical protein